MFPLYNIPTTNKALNVTAADLVARALVDTDFLSDLTPSANLESLALEYANQAAEIWEEDNSAQCPSEIIEAARASLLFRARVELAQREKDAADALADGVEAGDLNADGAAVAWR